MKEERRLGKLALLFLRLGATAFGGPAAHLALMRAEVVERRRWMTDGEYLDLLGATNLIPGPNSTEMAIHLGHRRAGWPGLLVAGTCFILPAVAIVGAIAWAYVRFGRLPDVEAVLRGVKPVIIAVVAQALWSLGRTALRSGRLLALCVAAVLAAAAGVHELLVLLAAGLLAVALARPGRGGLAAAVLGVPAWAAIPAVAAPVSLLGLLGVFLKVGAVLYGSCYVLLAFLRADLVERLGWMTEGQLLDAVAVGQITPGPVFTTATFIGYLLAGPGGAAAATVGIFLPAFVFVALSGPLVPRIRRSPVAAAFLDGVNVASLALMALVTAQLARAAVVGVWTAALACASALLLLRFRGSSVWLLAAGAAAGLLLGPALR
jgi:chromate transporter